MTRSPRVSRSAGVATAAVGNASDCASAVWGSPSPCLVAASVYPASPTHLGEPRIQLDDWCLLGAQVSADEFASLDVFINYSSDILAKHCRDSRKQEGGLRLPPIRQGAVSVRANQVM